MSRLLKTTLLSLTGLALSTAANAACSSGTYCQSSSTLLAPLSSWSNATHQSYSHSTTYPSGSISDSYVDNSAQTYGFHGSTSSIPGLGMNESLRATNCPTSVYNPEGGQVLGCYNVVKPVAQTRYYRIVRPVIYVRYPVPVAVPYYSGCTVVTHTSRYGGYGHHGHRCGH